MNRNVDVVIPTHRPDERFLRLLQRLERQSVQPAKVVIINTGQEGWDAFENRYGRSFDKLGLTTELIQIGADQFDHAGTRNLAAKSCDSELILMMTMDALPADRGLIQRLVNGFEDESVAVAYARQLPRKGATELEKQTRLFNYPAASLTKGKEDIPRLGIKTYFCSDACAMYRRDIFEQMGGFEEPAIFNEDMIYAAGVMEKGYRVSYRAEAGVYHSHNYSGLQQLRRNFDLGVSQVDHPHIFANISSEKEGIRMITGQIRSLLSRGRVLTVVSLIWISGCKWIGYFLGTHYKCLPEALIRRVTMNKTYWERKKLCAE